MIIYTLLIITILVCSSCSSQTPLTDSQISLSATTSDSNPTATDTIAPSTTPTFTTTPSPTIMQTATQTQTPTVTFTPTNTPILYGREPITIDNVANLALLAQWGKGSVTETVWLEELHSWIVQTPIGIYIYRDQPFEELAFFEGAKQFGVSMDNKKLVLRYSENTIEVVDLTTAKVENEFPFELKISRSDLDYLNSLPKDQYDQVFKQYMNYYAAFSSAAFSMDNDFLAISFSDNHIRVWNLVNETLVADLYHDVVNDVSQIAFSPDNQYLLTTFTFGQRSEIAYWDVMEEKLIWHKISAGHMVGQPFSPDGSKIVLEMTYAYSNDALVLVWDTKFGNEIGRVSGRVSSNPFSPNGDLLVTTSYTQIKIWSIPGVYLVKKFDCGLNWPSTTFFEDAKYISVNDKQQVWQIEDLTQAIDLQIEPPIPPKINEFYNNLRGNGHFPDLQDIFLLPNGNFRILGVDNVTAYWWDGPSTTVSSYLLPSENDIELKNNFLNTKPIFSDNGETLFYCVGEKLYRLDTKTMLINELSRCNPRSELSYSEDLDIIAKGSRTVLELREASTGELIHNMQGHLKTISHVTFSDDGKLMASGSTEGMGFGEIILWDTDPAIKLMRESHRPYIVYNIDFSPNNEWMATQSLGYIQIWSVPNQRLYSDFNNSGRSLAFLPDGNLLAASDYNGNIHFYQVPTGEELAIIEGHLGEISKFYFTKDGSNLFTISVDGTIRLWGIK